LGGILNTLGVFVNSKQRGNVLDGASALVRKRALEDLKVRSQLVHSANAEQALDYLRDEGNNKPCVVFWDLNTPKMNGIEFLRIVKPDEALKKIPIIALTTSREEQDIVENFKLGAAGYMAKDADYEKFVKTIQTINQYRTLSELPNED